MFRLHDSELDEEECEEREYRRLEKADDYLDREDIAEEPERERHHAHQLSDELDEPHGEADGISERILNEFAAVFPETDGENARHFDDEKGYDGEDERHGEVGIRRSQKRLMVVLKRADTRYEVQHVAHEDEQEYRHKQRKEFARHVAAFKRFSDVVVHKSDHCFHERLKLTRNHFQPATHQKSDGYEYRDDHPARNQRIGDGDSKKVPQLFRRDGNAYAFLHAG